MENYPENFVYTISHNISGFHQYRLNSNRHLCYVSRNLCNMLGFSVEELLLDTSDPYAGLVHPADRKAYETFLAALSQQE